MSVFLTRFQSPIVQRKTENTSSASINAPQNSLASRNIFQQRRTSGSYNSSKPEIFSQISSKQNTGNMSNTLNSLKAGQSSTLRQYNQVHLPNSSLGTASRLVSPNMVTSNLIIQERLTVDSNPRVQQIHVETKRFTHQTHETDQTEGIVVSFHSLDSK